SRAYGRRCSCRSPPPAISSPSTELLRVQTFMNRYPDRLFPAVVRSCLSFREKGLVARDTDANHQRRERKECRSNSENATAAKLLRALPSRSGGFRLFQWEIQLVVGAFLGVAELEVAAELEPREAF